MKIANELLKRCAYLIDNKKLSYAKYDMKSEVVLDYDEAINKPLIKQIILSIQHEPMNKKQKLFFNNQIKKLVIDEVIKNNHLNKDFSFCINNYGDFIIGGPIGDTGLTGRKLMVDSYGSIAHHGGGAFSGKDYTKVDRTGAYFARYIAKNIVAAKLADKCEVQLAYCIGNPKAISIKVDTFNTNHFDQMKIQKVIEKVFD